MGNETKIEGLSDNSPTKSEGFIDPEKNKIHLKYGLIAGVAIVILFIIYYSLGWSSDKDFKNWIPTVVFMLVIIAAQFAHNKSVNGDITFGNLFAKGFKTAAVGACVYVLFMIIFIWLVPAYKENMLEMSRQGMIDKGMAADKIKESMAMSKRSFMATAIAGSMIGELVLGLLASLAGAIAFRNSKKRLEPLN